MPEPRPVSQLVVFRLVWASMIGGSVLFLAIGLVLQRSREGPAGFETLAQIAAVYAILCPFLAVAIRGGGLLGDPVPSRLPEKDRRSLFSRQLAFLAVLESGAFLCAVALMLTQVEWPLLAGAVPVAVMVLSFPRSGPRSDTG